MFIFQKNFEVKNELTAFNPSKMRVGKTSFYSDAPGSEVAIIPAVWVTPKTVSTFTLGEVEIYFNDIPMPTAFEDILFEANHYKGENLTGYGRAAYGRHVSHSAHMIMGADKFWAGRHVNILEDVKLLTEFNEIVPTGGIPDGFEGWFKLSKRRP